MLVCVVVAVSVAGAEPLVERAGAAVGPANDAVAAAQVLGAEGAGLSFSTSGATKEVGEADHAGDSGGASVWFKWTAPSTGNVSFETSGSAFDTMIATYSGGPALSGLQLYGSNDDVGVSASHARTCIGAQAGETYWIAVDGFLGASGDAKLTWGPKTDVVPCPAEPPQVNNAGATPTVGMDLGSSNGTWVDYSYGPDNVQWFRCAAGVCDLIAGATDRRYVLTERDVGARMRVRFGDTVAGLTAYNTSAPTPVVGQTASTGENGRIVWARTEGSGVDLWSRFVDGSHEQLLTPTPNWENAPAVSPDGTILAYIREQAVWLAYADGSFAGAIPTSGGTAASPTWSPDGSRVAYIAEEPGGQPDRIRVYDLDTNEVHDLWTAPSLETILTEVSWSPRGDTLAVTIYVPGTPGRSDFDIALLAADGRGPLTYVTGPGDNEQSAAWSPTGDRIAFTRGVTPGNGVGNADLWVMDADGGNDVRLVDAPSSNPIWTASWAPDATRIVYDQVRGPGGGVDLHVVPSTGGSPLQLTADAASHSHPFWAARATFYVFLETIGTGSGTVTSSPAGISCSSFCWAGFLDPTLVTLTAAPAPGSSFTGWHGNCAGTAPCTVSMHGHKDVIAEFASTPPPPPPPPSSGGGGAVPPDLTVSVSAAKTTLAPAEIVEVRVVVATKEIAAATGLRATITLPAGATLLGPPAFDRGRGCTGTTTLDCNLDYLPASTSTQLRFSIDVGSAGAKTITARASAANGERNEQDNSASLTLAVVAPQPPPTTPTIPTRSTGVTRNGTGGPNVLTGTALADLLNGRAGNDRLNGLAGADRLFGGAGADQILGGSGNDHLVGGTGHDRLFGQAGNDRLLGGTGDDQLNGGNGRDVLDGGAGNDTINAADRTKDIVRCGRGRDTVLADRTDTVSPGCERVHRRP